MSQQNHGHYVQDQSLEEQCLTNKDAELFGNLVTFVTAKSKWGVHIECTCKKLTSRVDKKQSFGHNHKYHI